MSIDNPKMVPSHDALARQLALTVPGMAHFATTGPKGTTCGECEFLQPALNKKTENRCQRYFWMMREWSRTHLPASTPSCKHFSEKQT